MRKASNSKTKVPTKEKKLPITDQRVSDFVKRLRKKIKLTRVIWFGSRSRDEHLETSDYDFIVVSPSFSRTPFIRRPVSLYRLWNSNHGVDLLCYTPAEFERKSQEICIVREAVETGRQVYP